MELVDPVENIGDQEVTDFVFAEIENTCAPVRVFAAAGIRIFEDAFAVELGQAVGIRAEVRRYPVQDDADPGVVQLVDHIHEVIGRAITGSRCIIPCYLIAP